MSAITPPAQQTNAAIYVAAQELARRPRITHLLAAIAQCQRLGVDMDMFFDKVGDKWVLNRHLGPYLHATIANKLPAEVSLLRAAHSPPGSPRDNHFVTNPTHMQLVRFPARFMDHVITMNAENLDHNLADLTVAKMKILWANQRFRAHLVPPPNAPKTWFTDAMAYWDRMRRVQSTIFNFAIAAGIVHLQRGGSPDHAEIKKACSVGVAMLYTTRGQLYRLSGFAQSQKFVLSAIDDAAAALNLAHRSAKTGELKQPFRFASDVTWVKLGFKSSDCQAPRLAPQQRETLPDNHQDIRFGLYRKGDRLDMGLFMPTKNHRVLTRAFANGDLFSHGLSMRHLGGAVFEFSMTVAVEGKDRPKRLAQVDPTKSNANHPALLPALPQTPPNMPSVDTRGPLQPKPPASRPRKGLKTDDTDYVIGGLAAIDPGARTLATVYLPHFSVFVSVGDGLAKHIATCRAQQARYEAVKSAAGHALRTYHKEPRAHVCLRLGLTRAGYRQRVGKLHREIAECKQRIKAIDHHVRMIVKHTHIALQRFLCANARLVVFPHFNVREMIRTRATFETEYLCALDAALAAGASCLPPKPSFRELHAKTKDDLSALCIPLLRERLKYGLGICGVSVWIVGEEYTSKMCGHCLALNNVGGSKVYKCKRCLVWLERDENGARNIFLKFLAVLQSHGVGAALEFLDISFEEAKKIVGAPQRHVVGDTSKKDAGEKGRATQAANRAAKKANG